jgi:signal transduction histidine kinase/ligand-binding sensor domain-containing protein
MSAMESVLRRAGHRPGSVAMRAVLACGFLIWCAPVFALNPALDVSQYAHTAWTVHEGFVNSRVSAIAQTPDGYLWLGTETGLFRFDGVRMVRWQPRGQTQLPHVTVVKLLVSRDGRLWIGTFAGLASLKDGQLITYPELAGEVIGSLVEDSLGTVWVGTITIPSARLCAIHNTIQCDVHERLGNGVFSLLEDRGALWVGATTGLWRWAPREPTRYATPISSVSDLLRVGDGPLLIAMTGGVKQLVGDKLDAYRITGLDQPVDAHKLLVDRDGGLWIGTSRQGLVHLHQGRVDRYTTADGLSNDTIEALYEDREGNIWVGTSEGLDRFRGLAVTTVSRKQGLPAGGLSVLAARDGTTWVGTSDGVSRWSDGRTTIYRTRDGLPDNHVGTLFEDSTRRVLVSTPRGIAAFDGDRFVRLLRSDPTRIVYSFVEERAGDFWISDQEQGLLHLVGADVVTRIPWSALGHDDHANVVIADRSGRGLWLGFYKGGVALLQDGALRASYSAADGLGAGRVSELKFDREGALWVATAGGLSRIKDNRILTLGAASGLPCDGVHWTIEDADRALWMLMPCGLARIGPAELAAWIADPRRMIANTLFNNADGVRALSTPIGFNPSVARLSDGRLWFATATGIGAVDPRHLSFNALPPAVHIESIVADRKTYDATMAMAGGVRLPALTRDLQIDYTALSLAAPEKMQFRYRLEGRDRDWQDAGNRRQAFYNDLAPGSYRFRVIAANNSGVWNETGATVDFAIAPAYYQTAWFPTVVVGMLVAVAWAAYRIRIGIVETHQQEISALNERLMKAQEQERIRIAGELHDGVMQEMLAATMMLGSAKRRVASDSDAKATIDKVQEKLIRVGTDIRQLSHDLHPPVLQEQGLPDAVRAYCEQFSASSGMPVSCDADDGVRDLSRGAALALFRIVQEALGNAAKHAHATRITVRLARSADEVSLAVSDDGTGFDSSRLGTSGGLGLIMMRERASQLNGKFEFESAPGRGTTITVAIPFR